MRHDNNGGGFKGMLKEEVLPPTDTIPDTPVIQYLSYSLGMAARPTCDKLISDPKAR